MKKILLSAILVLISCVTYAQDIELSYQNAQITNDGMDDFYQVDVFVKADDPFKYGFGQFYITYNTAAFGMTPDDSGDFFFEQPAGSLLDLGIDAAPAAKFFSGFNSSDNIPGIVSVNWQHGFAASTIAANTVTATPRFLCTVRFRYVDVAQDPMICFDIDLTSGENAEACGPFASANPFELADCTGFPAVVRTNDSYDCTGAVLPVEVCTGGTTTFTAGGVWDNNPPDNTMTAIIEGDYSTLDFGNIEACELFITSNGSLTIGPDTYVRVQNDITNEGELDILPQGSFVQVEDDGEAINVATMSVFIETPLLKPRDFMVLGSPVTNAAPVGMDNPIFRKLIHTTSNFTPNQAVQMAFPGGTNFVDEQGDDWTLHNDVYFPARGFYTQPQIDLTDGDKQYNLRFNQSAAEGTLNTGTITQTLIFNTGGTAAENKNASPNLISNPYPSAISAVDFMNANDAVDELYFWEHNTTPDASFPGWNDANFNMADISVFNDMGFNPAATGSPTGMTAGDFSIATAQGFGIKNNGATTGTGQMLTFTNAMRRVDNNNTLRNTVTQKDRLWIHIKSNEYDWGSTTLIGFTQNATPGLDAKYDSKRIGTPVSIYSHLSDGTAQLAIQGREAFDDTKQVHLGFSSQIEDDTTQYTISLSEIDGELIANSTVFLRDNLLETITVLNDLSYTFTSAAGTFDNRFTVLFKNNEVLSNNENIVTTISVYPNPADEIVTIQSPVALINEIIIRDMQGRTIASYENLETNSTSLNIATLKSAVYFVTLKTQKGNITKRIIKK